MAKSTKGHAEAANDLTFEKGLPADVETERLCLGSVILDDAKWEILSGILKKDDFSLEKHRRIYARMADIHERGERIDRVTLISELQTQGQLESVDGMSYIVDLDAGLPDIPNLQAYCRIVLEKSHLRSLIFAGQRQIDQALAEIAPAKDIAAASVIALEPVQVGRVESKGQTAAQIIESYPGGISAFLDPTLRVKGLPTGFTKFDEMTAGLHPGDLAIIAARPSMGKTALALNIAQHITMHPKVRKPVAIFSLEMSSASLLTRMLCTGARVDAQKFRLGYLNADDRLKLQIALDAIMDGRLIIFDESGMNEDEICRHIRRLVDKEELALAIVDYLQLIGVKNAGENRNLELSGVTRKLKITAKDCGIPVIALSQLSRANEKRVGSKVPILSDLRDSGAIEQDADLVGFIHREEIYKRDDITLKGLADLIIAKQRNGPIGTVPLRFLGHITKFESRTDDLAEEEPAEEPPPLAPPPREDEW